MFVAHKPWLDFHIWTNTTFDCHICLADTELMFCPDKDTFPLKAPSLYHSACRSLFTPFLAIPPSRGRSWALVTHSPASSKRVRYKCLHSRSQPHNLQVGPGAALRSQLDSLSSNLKVTHSVSATSYHHSAPCLQSCCFLCFLSQLCTAHMATHLGTGQDLLEDKLTHLFCRCMVPSTTCRRIFSSTMPPKLEVRPT